MMLHISNIIFLYGTESREIAVIELKTRFTTKTTENTKLLNGVLIKSNVLRRVLYHEGVKPRIKHEV